MGLSVRAETAKLSANFVERAKATTVLVPQRTADALDELSL